MTKVIAAKVYIRDSGDPNSPGDCAPVLRVEGATKLEGLVSEHGISFEEAIHEQEESFTDDLVNDEEMILEPDDLELEPEMELDEFQTDQPECRVDPDVDWDESVCGEIERRILSRILGG